jgi:hypothetical protein
MDMQLHRYGEGDNSVYDRMFYEDAVKICTTLENQRMPVTTRLSVEYVRQQIEAIVKREIKLEKS